MAKEGICDAQHGQVQLDTRRKGKRWESGSTVGRLSLGGKLAPMLASRIMSCGGPGTGRWWRRGTQKNGGGWQLRATVDSGAGGAM